MTTFELWPIPLGGGAWGAGTNMRHPETPASYESLPAPLAIQISTLWIHTSGWRGRGGSLILDRFRAFDLFASVDAHLWQRVKIEVAGSPKRVTEMIFRISKLFHRSEQKLCSMIFTSKSLNFFSKTISMSTESRFPVRYLILFLRLKNIHLVTLLAGSLKVFLEGSGVPNR